MDAEIFVPFVFFGFLAAIILVPIWLLTYTYGRKAYQVIVNGYTGQFSIGHAGFLARGGSRAATLAILGQFHKLGVRIVQLTYNVQNRIASGCWEDDAQGVSKFFGRGAINN